MSEIKYEWQTPEFIRKHTSKEIAIETALKVREDKACNCCPAREVERMDCGHLICERCKYAEHPCIPCALMT